jgi:hypothetical protein
LTGSYPNRTPRLETWSAWKRRRACTDPEIILSTRSMGFFTKQRKENYFLYIQFYILFTCALNINLLFCIFFQNKIHTPVLLPLLFFIL